MLAPLKNFLIDFCMAFGHGFLTEVFVYVFIKAFAPRLHFIGMIQGIKHFPTHGFGIFRLKDHAIVPAISPMPPTSVAIKGIFALAPSRRA